MAASAFPGTSPETARLADPALREALLKLARRRLPPTEVDDLVQSTLADALVSANAPSEEVAFRRWVQGIARHKIADSYRRRTRLPALDAEAEPAAADAGPGASELRQWIARELPETEDAKATLYWLLRESDGETLDEIARDAALPAPRVRQRVSRLRRHFKSRWLALGAAGLALLIGAGVLFHAWRASQAPPIARESVAPRSSEARPAGAPSAAPVPNAPTSAPESKSAPPQRIKSTRLPRKKSTAPHAPEKPKQPPPSKQQQVLLDAPAPPLFNQLSSKSNGNSDRKTDIPNQN